MIFLVLVTPKAANPFETCLLHDDSEGMYIYVHSFVCSSYLYAYIIYPCML